MRARSAAMACVLACALTACGTPAGVVKSQGVEVSAQHAGLRVRNGRSDAIYFFAVDARVATLINWAPCTDPARCQSVPPDRLVQLDSAQITGFGQSPEVILYWWQLRPATNGFEFDSIRALRAMIVPR